MGAGAHPYSRWMPDFSPNRRVEPLQNLSRLPRMPASHTTGPPQINGIRIVNWPLNAADSERGTSLYVRFDQVPFKRSYRRLAGNLLSRSAEYQPGPHLLQRIPFQIENDPYCLELWLSRCPYTHYFRRSPFRPVQDEFNIVREALGTSSACVCGSCNENPAANNRRKCGERLCKSLLLQEE